MKCFLKWWMSSCLIAAGMYIASIYEIFQKIYEVDFTYLSFVIMSICIYFIIRCGHLSYLAASSNTVKKLNIIKLKQESGWTAGSLCQKLGLLGTLIGFATALIAFKDIDFGNVATTHKVISNLSMSISTAITTTIAGLCCNIVLVLQYHNLLSYIDNKLLTLEKEKKRGKRKK